MGSLSVSERICEGNYRFGFEAERLHSDFADVLAPRALLLTVVRAPWVQLSAFVVVRVP